MKTFLINLVRNLTKPTQQNSTAASRATLQLEQLDERRVLSTYTMDYASGLLTINGTSASDTVKLTMTVSSPDPTTWTVDVNDSDRPAPFSLSANLVHRVRFNGGDSADMFTNKTWLPCDAYGGAGNDTLIGGWGKDVLLGEGGNDELSGQGWGELTAAMIAVYDQHGGRGNDEIYGGDGNDNLNGTGGGNWLDGGTGDDLLDVASHESGIAPNTLFGRDGNDTLWGGDGTDYLYGGDGLDRLDGGSGNNYLDGGNDAFRDELTGGFGSDTFYQYNGSVQETIYELSGTLDTVIYVTPAPLGKSGGNWAD